jgi:hypothetical protein
MLIAGVVAAMVCLEARAQVFYETVAGNETHPTSRLTRCAEALRRAGA